MTCGDVAHIAVSEVHAYANSDTAKDLLGTFGGSLLTAALAEVLLRPLCKRLKERGIPADIVELRLLAFCPDAAVCAQRNAHMHRAQQFEHLDRDLLNAVLVGFVNWLVAPLDLALYARDLEGGLPACWT